MQITCVLFDGFWGMAAQADRGRASRRLGAMSSRASRGIGPLAVVSHLAVMVAVAGLTGLLVAGLAIPFAAVAGLGARNMASSMDNLPSDLTAEPLAQRTRVLAADGSLLATWYDQNRINVRLDKV